MVKQIKLIFLIAILILILAVVLIIRMLNPQKDTLTPTPQPTPFYQTLPGGAEGTPEQIDPEIYTTKNWINKLPIAGNNYYIDAKIEYMATDSAVLVMIFTNSSSSIPQESQISSVKTEVIGKLKEIGVDLSKEKIIYQIR